MEFNDYKEAYLKYKEKFFEDNMSIFYWQRNFNQR